MLTADQVTEFLKTLHNPRYCNADQTGPIILDGTFNNGPMEFYASPWDMMDYGKEIYQKAIDGAYGPIGPYQSPVEKPAKLIEKMDAREIFPPEKDLF
jgi:hypothetical protein